MEKGIGRLTAVAALASATPVFAGQETIESVPVAAGEAAAALAQAERLEASAGALRRWAAARQAADRELAEAGIAIPAAPPATPARETGAEARGTPRAAAPEARDSANESGGTRQFGGLEFGVGISFTLDIGTSDRISDAELVNGIVRVRDENNGVARIMLESHYLFVQNRRGPFGTPSGRWGHGPFIALQPGTDDIIEAIGIGWMLGFRRPVPPDGEDTGQSFNLGFGIVVDPNTRILGDGIVANQPLPDGETAIRYQEQMQTGILALASFSF